MNTDGRINGILFGKGQREGYELEGLGARGKVGQPVVAEADLQVDGFSGVGVEDDLRAAGDHLQGGDEISQRI